jgi:hypothetical protein
MIKKQTTTKMNRLFLFCLGGFLLDRDRVTVTRHQALFIPSLFLM